jgi:hypothetical protein
MDIRGFPPPSAMNAFPVPLGFLSNLSIETWTLNLVVAPQFRLNLWATNSMSGLASAWISSLLHDGAQAFAVSSMIIPIMVQREVVLALSEDGFLATISTILIASPDHRLISGIIAVRGGAQWTPPIRL